MGSENLETKRKKHEKKYEKKPLKFHTLNVANYLALAPKDSARSQTIRYMFIEYLNTHRNTEFYSYEDIAQRLRKEYEIPDSECQKGTVSKIVRGLHGDLIFEDGTYYFAKIGRVYKLRPRFAEKDPLLVELFKLKSAFTKGSVFSINENTLVFSVDPNQIDKVKEGFSKLLGPTMCFGIMACDQHLVIMLDTTNPKVNLIRAMLLDFFNRKARYEESLKQQKISAQAMDARDKAIKKEQKKKRGHDLSVPAPLGIKI